MGVIKDVPIKFHKYLSLLLVKYIVVVDLPSLFSIYLSKELMPKIGGYMAMEYYHMMVPFKDNRIRKMNEVTSSSHTERVLQFNMVNEEYEMTNI